MEGSSTEGSSSDAAMLTSPRVSLAKSRARCEEEKKREEEEASNRVSPPLQDVEMQDPPRDEGAEQEEVKAREVPAIEVARTVEVPAIEVGRTQAESSGGARAPPAKEEAKEDESLDGHLVVVAKVTHEWVKVSLLPRSFVWPTCSCRCCLVMPSYSPGSGGAVGAGRPGAGRREHRHQSGGEA